MIKTKITNFFERNYFFIIFFFYLTIFYDLYYDQSISFTYSKHDYEYHLRFIYLFKDNSIFESLKLYGKEGYEVRNSPIFYIIYGFLNKYLSLDILQKLNTIVSALIAFVFFKCLKIKYISYSNIFLTLLACVIFTSPTLRSLSVWPYPLIWGIFFFIISIYYFLRFKTAPIKKKFIFSVYTTIFIAFASYIQPTLSLFNIFYLVSFYKIFKNKKLFSYILLINFFFVVPVFFFFTQIDFLFFYKAEGLEISKLKSINIFNKIIIITTIILYFILPAINLFELYKELLRKINFKIIVYASLITIFFSFFFNYEFSTSFGGGFVHKASYLLFKNYIFLFLFFLLSILILYSIFNDKINNYLIYSIFIITNIQYTIYNKYYDILVLIVFFLLADVNFNKFFFKKKYSLIYLYLLYLFYYILVDYKNYFYNLFL